MSALPTTILDRHRGGAAATMYDRGQVLARQQTGHDRHHRPTYAYTPQTETACGVRTAVNREGTGNVPLPDYIIRLPHGTAVRAQDRFRITQRHGWSGGSAEDCEILGVVDEGPTAVVIKVRRITHGG